MVNAHELDTPKLMDCMLPEGAKRRTRILLYDMMTKESRTRKRKAKTAAA